ncbi:serine hydrolase [Mucilaginibacter sp. AW1-3]
MTIKTALIFLLSAILCIHQVKAQQDKANISGKVVSAETQQPLHAVSISINKKGVGTATNTSGHFMLIVPLANFNDTLRISCIGFQTRFLAIADLINGQPVNISLKANNTELKEVSVEYRDPLKIIQKAIDRIPQNYINHPHITRGFYRMYTAKGNEPLELSEAVFDIYNFGYADKRADLFKLIKARDEKNQRDFHSLELGQKPNTIFNYDVVNHLMASGFLSDRGLSRHHFEFGGIIDVRGYPAYEIDFSENENIQGDSFRGKFYVDTKSYAFIYFDYGLSPKALREAELGNFSDRMLTGSDDIRIGLKHDHTAVGYQKVGDKWVISDVVGNDALSINSAGLNYNYVADVKFNYQVTSVDTAQTESFSNKLNRHENINDHDSNDGEEFWKDYNVLLSDFNTEAIFKHIKAVNGQTKLKDKFEEKLRKLPADTVQRLDALLKFYHDNGQFNGTVLIKSKGKVILSKSYGYADKEHKTEANSHTTYRIGSVANTFTSLIIAQLINENKIDLQVPVKTYIPYYANGDITIRQLLTQQSGIPDYMSNEEYKKQLLSQSFALKQMVINFCSDTLNFKSGTRFEYSNANFVVLALIAEEVTGKAFATLLQERVFTPLQMMDSYFGTYKEANNYQAKGYRDNKPEPVYDAANMGGAGGIFSSADDLLKYHDGLQSNKLLTTSQKAEMLKPRVEYADHNAWYDYGWMTDKSEFDASKKHVINYCTGTDWGFYTLFVRQEDTDSCIILLNNTGDFPQYDMADLILNILN